MKWIGGYESKISNSKTDWSISESNRPPPKSKKYINEDIEDVASDSDNSWIAHSAITAPSHHRSNVA